MEYREDLRSILPFLPVILRSSALFWPPAVVEVLKDLSRGPSLSNVKTGQLFAFAVDEIRNSLGFPPLHRSASLGFSLFFDDLISKDESDMWFEEVVPRLAELLMTLPALLETHYSNTDIIKGMETHLRLLESQKSGVVFLSQELIAALLVCALFCLFPATNRGAQHLPRINFDDLFVCLYEDYDLKQENKVKCIVHYFKRICLNIPMGNISFERKVLPLKNSTSDIVYPDADYWSKSSTSLCNLEVCVSGLIEDQSTEALEVDFANKYIGGGVLGRGCVQEEIRFVVNTELLISMLFLPSMADNEAIEIVGAERFSAYTGYASSFRFRGDYVDKKVVDSMGRRKTRIIAIDALCHPGQRQYRVDCLLRETNKAFCGFLDQNKSQRHHMLFEEQGYAGAERDKETGHATGSTINGVSPAKYPSDNWTSSIGVATGNWGCGAFGGDAEIKVVIQWLAASQAQRPFILYHTFGLEQLQKLEMVAQWIKSHGWTVGEFWNMLLQYSTQLLKGETRVGLFKWLLPSLYDMDNEHDDDSMIVDVPHIGC